MDNNNTILADSAPLTEKEKELDETEKAALFIHNAHKQFRSLAYAVARKKNAVARVLEAVLFEPLEEVKLIGKQEEQLFEICRHIMKNKGIVMEYTFERAKTRQKGVKDNEQQ